MEEAIKNLLLSLYYRTFTNDIERAVYHQYLHMGSTRADACLGGNVLTWHQKPTIGARNRGGLFGPIISHSVVLFSSAY